MDIFNLMILIIDGYMHVACWIGYCLWVVGLMKLSYFDFVVGVEFVWESMEMFLTTFVFEDMLIF